MWIGGSPVSVFSGAELKFSILVENCGSISRWRHVRKTKKHGGGATEALIDIYNEKRIQLSLENLKTSKENSKIWTDNNS